MTSPCFESITNGELHYSKTGRIGEMATDRKKVLQLVEDSDERIPENWNARGEMHEPGCNDVLKMYLEVNSSNFIVDAGFEITEGACAPAVAASWVATNMAKDKALLAAYTVKASQIAEEMTDDGILDREHVHCAQMAELALKKAVLDYVAKQ